MHNPFDQLAKKVGKGALVPRGSPSSSAGSPTPPSMRRRPLRRRPLPDMNRTDVMSWTKDDQTKLDLLRGRELAGTLTGPEHAELAALMARVEAEEAVALAPEMARLRAEVVGAADELHRIERENEELARLM